MIGAQSMLFILLGFEYIYLVLLMKGFEREVKVLPKKSSKLKLVSPVAQP
jgi:hypothetical protein